MRFFVFLSLFFGATVSQLAVADMAKVCKAFDLIELARDAEETGISPEDLCRECNGSNCGYADSYGEAICRGERGSNCGYTESLGEGICRAARGSNCGYTESYGEGICRALRGSNCGYTDSLGEGICRGMRGSNCSYVDTPEEEWKWRRALRKACRGER